MRLTVCAAVSCLLLSSPLVSAFVVRDAPILNSTTGHNSASDSPATPSLDLPSNPQTQTATRTQEHTAFKPKFETSVSGFEENIKPSPSRNGRPLQSSVDIGSIIASWISVVPTIHYESTATGFDEQYTRTREQAPERFEVTVTDFMGDDKATKGGQQDAVITPPPNKPPTVTLNTRTLSPVPIASVVINDQTLTPGGDTATIPAGSGAEPTKIHLDTSGRPVIVVGTSTSTVRPSTVIDGQTLEPEGPPVTVGTGFEITTFSINPAGQTLAIHEGLTSTLPAAPTQGVFTVGSITATPLASDMQYLVDSSRLVLGTPITIDGTRIALTTDTSGLTILAVGDKTTTLMPNIQAQMQSQAQEPLSIPTIVVDGTTQYIIGTETLSPNHPITVDGTVISMRTMSGATVLVVGDKTTTIGAMATTTGASAVRTTSAGGGEGALASATATGKKNGAGNVVDKGRSSVILGALVGVLGVAVG